MRQPTAEDLNRLLSPHQAPCISLYQTTHRHYPGIQEDPIRFKNLLRHAQDLLRARSQSRDSDRLIQQIEAIASSGKDFWTHQLDGLAVFCSPDFFLALQIPMPVEDSVTVNESFRTTPLVRAIQTTGRFQLLCFELHNVRLFEGNQFSLNEIDLIDVPRTVEQLQTEAHWLTRYTSGYGNSHKKRGPAGAEEPRDRQVDIERANNQDAVQFIRVVDRAIWENHSRLAGIPMLLCCADEYQPIFRKVTQNQNLINEGIRLDPHHLPLERLREEAWKIMGSFHQKRVDQVVDAFRTAKARNMAADSVESVAQAVAMGRVGTLLVDSNKHLAGHMDPLTGQVEIGNPSQDPKMDDVLDEAAERVLRTGGQVFVVPPEVMPTDCGMAAIYRY